MFAALKTALTYAALFRHAKQHNPEMFGAFVDSLRTVPVAVVQPPRYQVVTPTLYPKDVQARSPDVSRSAGR